MKKSSKKNKRKLIPIQYVNTNAPLPGDVNDFLKAIKRYWLKNGPRVYQKNRERTDHLVRRLLTKHNVIGTISARFWYLDAYCMLIQKSAEQIAKDLRRAKKILRRQARLEKRKKHASKRNSKNKR
jgi:hypothetical protein